MAFRTDPFSCFRTESRLNIQESLAVIAEPEDRLIFFRVGKDISAVRTFPLPAG